MKNSIFESNKYLNQNINNLFSLNKGLNFENIPDITNFRNDIKLFDEPLSHKINFLIQTQENKNIQNINQKKVLNNNNENIQNKISFNIDHINNINNIKKNNDNLNNKSGILYKIPQPFNDNKENKKKDNQIKNNNNEINESNINNIKENIVIQNNDLFNLIFNNNDNNFIFNKLNQAYNKILFPGFNNILDFKNNYYNPINLFSNYLYSPINQGNNISTNNNRNIDDFIINNFLNKKVMFNK